MSYTSLKEFIPGYAANSMRKQAILNANKLDSLTISYNQSLNQLNSIKKVLTGDIKFEEFKEIEFKLDTGNIEVKLTSKKILADSLLRNKVEQRINTASTVTQEPIKAFFSLLHLKAIFLRSLIHR